MSSPFYSPSSRPQDQMAATIGNLMARVRALEAIVKVGFYEIKIVADDATAPVMDGAFVFAIPADLDGKRLYTAEGFVSGVGSSDTVVQIRNPDIGDLLSTPITIEAGQNTSYTAATQPVIDPTFPVPIVFKGTLIAIDIDSNGTDALGLGVMLSFQ